MLKVEMMSSSLSEKYYATELESLGCFPGQTLGKVRRQIRPWLFQSICGLAGPTVGPGSPGSGSGWKTSAGCAKSQPQRPSLRPVRWHFVVLGSAETKRRRSKVKLKSHKFSPATSRKIWSSGPAPRPHPWGWGGSGGRLSSATLLKRRRNS